MRTTISSILIITLILFMFSGCSEEEANIEKVPLVKTQRVGEARLLWNCQRAI